MSIQNRLLLSLILAFIIVITSCTKKGEVFHPACGSMFCSLNGQNELTSVLQLQAEDDTLIFLVQIIDAANQKNNHSNLLGLENDLNYTFKKAKIRFKVNPSIKEVVNQENIDSIFNHVALKNSLLKKYNLANAINIYIVPKGNYLNGYTNVLTENFKLYPFTEYNYLIINEKAIFNGNTIEHEFGHFFGLQHTFGKSPKENSTDEKPDASNCYEAGDFICDTPADPNGKIDKNCVFVGLSTGEKYPVIPDVTNFMSYYPASCKMQFSDMQYLLIQNFGKKYRTYLTKN